MTRIYAINPSAQRRRLPRRRDLVDCAGAQLRVVAQSVATVLSVGGEVDAANTDHVADAIRRYSQLRMPLVVDLSGADFVGVAAFRALHILDCEHREAGLPWKVVSGAALRPHVRANADHGLPLVESVAEALQQIEAAVTESRLFFADLVRKREQPRRLRPLA